nr:glycerophosphodiester phosphodiesterase family protein [uncultured Ralstonia sp.]
MSREQRRRALAALTRSRPLCIAHRGASGHRLENTLEAFALAARLNADMWEIDVQLTADGVCVVSHDDNLHQTAGENVRIQDVSYAQLRTYRLRNGEPVPSVREVVELAVQTGCGLYIELKAKGSGPKVVALLEDMHFSNAVLGSFDVDQITELSAADCPYPLSVLVPCGADPFALAERACADMIHLCWEKASETPHQLLTGELLDKAAAGALPIVAWHEERASEIAQLMRMPVWGICSDLPEMIATYQPYPENPIEIVCHRGAATVAPENTLAGADLGYRMGAQTIELDLHTTADQQLVVIHDDTLDRTTNLKGPVCGRTLAELSQCDAGSWFHPRYSTEVVSPFSRYLALANRHRKSLYVELKVANVDQVLQEVAAHDGWQRCFFWSFDAACVDRIQSAYPQARVMRRRQDYPTLAALLAAGVPYVVEYDYRIDNLSEFAQCRAAGAKVMLRFFADETDAAIALIGRKPDMVNVDDPFAFSRAYRIWQQQRKSCGPMGIPAIRTTSIHSK